MILGRHMPAPLERDKLVWPIAIDLTNRAHTSPFCPLVLLLKLNKQDLCMPRHIQVKIRYARWDVIFRDRAPPERHAMILYHYRTALLERDKLFWTTDLPDRAHTSPDCALVLPLNQTYKHDVSQGILRSNTENMRTRWDVIFRDPSPRARRAIILGHSPTDPPTDRASTNIMLFMLACFS